MITTSLIHLSTSLVRSKLSYAQAVFLSAPTYLLTKLKSVDCIAYKLVLGVPMHASFMETYREVGLLPPDEFRQLVSAKWTIYLGAQPSQIQMMMKLSLKSDVDFPKMAKIISSLTSMNSCLSSLTSGSQKWYRHQLIATLPIFQRLRGNAKTNNYSTVCRSYHFYLGTE